MARYGLESLFGKKKKKKTNDTEAIDLSVLDEYNEELREKEKEKAREKPTKKGQAVSKDISYTKPEAAMGAAIKFAKPHTSKLFGEEYDESLRKRKAKKKRRRSFDTK